MIDKIIKKLEEYQEAFSFIDNDDNANVYFTIESCIDIVKQAAAEGGWIKCSERLPDKRTEEDGSRAEFNVMIKSATVPTTLSINDMNEWFDDNSHAHFKYDVIAWQPLPEPFKESD